MASGIEKMLRRKRCFQFAKGHKNRGWEALTPYHFRKEYQGGVIVDYWPSGWKWRLWTRDGVVDRYGEGAEEEVLELAKAERTKARREEREEIANEPLVEPITDADLDTIFGDRATGEPVGRERT